jgi:hypothetical protein
MPEMLAELDVERRLEHLLGQTGEQPTRPGQIDTLRACRGNQLVR